MSGRQGHVHQSYARAWYCPNGVLSVEPPDKHSSLSNCAASLSNSCPEKSGNVWAQEPRLDLCMPVTAS